MKKDAGNILLDFIKQVESDPKKPILVNSVSGGETSVFMAKWVMENKSNEYHILNVFMNTGEERIESLDFMDKADDFFDLNTIWIESVTQLKFQIEWEGNNKIVFTVDRYKEYLKTIGMTRDQFETHSKVRKINVGQSYNIVNRQTASIDGKPFKDLIYKRGLPNIKYPHCTRDLKTMTFKCFMRSVMKSVGRKSNDYYTAIGIRADEFDRISAQKEKNKLIYPLIEWITTTKKNINLWWHNKPFRLTIKSFEGNCKVCIKKSLRTLLTLAKHRPHLFDNFKEWEKMQPGYAFYRGNLTVEDIMRLSKQPFTEATDNRHDYPDPTLFDHPLDVTNGCEESCNVF